MNYPVYLVVATSGRCESVENLLKDLCACTLPGNYRGLLLVENGARGRVEELALLEQYSKLRIEYLYDAQPSKSNALNVALRMIAEDNALLYFLDDDISINPGAVQAFSAVAEHNGPGHYFGGDVERAPGSAIPRPWMVPLLPKSVLGSAPATIPDNSCFLGCNWAAFKCDLVAAGGFDIRFGPGAQSGATGQETVMQHQLVRAGCVARFVPDAPVAHKVEDTSITLGWVARRRYRSGLQSGILGVSPATLYDRSFRPDSGLQVLDPDVAPVGFQRIKYRLARAIVNLAVKLGKRRGARLRSTL